LLMEIRQRNCSKSIRR